MKSHFSMPLRAVFYRQEGNWIAHCLEFDLVGHGNTKEEALKLLGEAIICQAQFSSKHHNPKNLFTPADGKYFRMFAAGKKDAIESKFLFTVEGDEPITIEGIDAREFSEEDAEPAEAVCI